MNWLWQNAEKIGALAGAASAALALVAILFAARQTSRQIEAGQKSAKEVNALQAYQSYLRSCVERPTFGSWEIFSATYHYSDPKVLMKTAKEETERYYWFVYEMLLACEQILTNVDTENWRTAIKSQIWYHKEFISLIWADRAYPQQMWSSVFSSKLDDIVRSVID